MFQVVFCAPWCDLHSNRKDWSYL